jgi:hypothetical protein
MAPVRRDSTHGVSRAAHSVSAVPQDVGVDHGRRDVAVAEELLDRSDVVAAFEEVGGERVPEGVAGDALSMPETRAASATARWVTVSCRWCRPSLPSLSPPVPGCREDPVPLRIPGRRRNLSGDGVRQPGLAPSGGQCRVSP